MILRWIGPRPPTISQSPCGTERGPRQILTYQLNTLPGASWRFVRLPWIQGGRKKEQRYDSLPTSYHYKSPKKYLGPQKKVNTNTHVHSLSHTLSHMQLSFTTLQSCLSYFTAHGLVELPLSGSQEAEEYHLPRVQPLDNIVSNDVIGCAKYSN